MIRRGFWIVLMLGLLAWPLWRGVGEVRQTAREKTLLLEVQRALQNFHIDQERYVPRETLGGHELLTVLDDFGFLDSLPQNPWTGEPYTLAAEEPDFLEYGSDPAFETYVLRTLDPKTGETSLELDSMESTSLE